MSYDDAVKYCEEHECTECEIYLKDLDKRTEHEKKILHHPCCLNLVDDYKESKQHNIFREATKEEQESVNKYIKEHSVYNGINFNNFID